ncbi:DUF1015 domain-containing protein [Candidatus Fermentibacteria bacterium]|nr:DUF1015 domain-containing protein [Candidatus Fermentibacteria bacterium]
MARIRPFKGLRPLKEYASRVAAPPYDVLDSDEAREMAAGNPYSILHVTKPEIDLDPSIDLYDPRVYARGAENFRKMIADGVLVQDPEPCFYFYRQIMGDHAQVGLVGCASVEDYDRNVIRKHEFTRKDKEEDRLRHIDALNAQVGPVFLTYPDVAELSAIQAEVGRGEPEYDFTAPDGVRHTLWLASGEAVVRKIEQLFADVPALYVADGHHRSAAAAILARRRREADPGHTGNEEYNGFLAVIFPKSHMRILPYNRVVKDLNGHSPAAFMDLVSKNFEIVQSAPASPGRVHEFSMYMNGSWIGLRAKDGTYPHDDPVMSLDSSILQNNLLGPVLGIEDPRTDKRIGFVGGIRGTGELSTLVDTGRYAVAFSLYPTTMDQLLRVAESGNVMPPKSTWFEPKLRSGLVIHLL